MTSWETRTLRYLSPAPLFTYLSPVPVCIYICIYFSPISDTNISSLYSTSFSTSYPDNLQKLGIDILLLISNFHNMFMGWRWEVGGSPAWIPSQKAAPLACCPGNHGPEEVEKASSGWRFVRPPVTPGSPSAGPRPLPPGRDCAPCLSSRLQMGGGSGLEATRILVAS